MIVDAVNNFTSFQCAQHLWHDTHQLDCLVAGISLLILVIV